MWVFKETYYYYLLAVLYTHHQNIKISRRVAKFILTVWPFLGPSDKQDSIPCTPPAFDTHPGAVARCAPNPPTMFRRVSKSVSRKGKTAYKFKFEISLANLTGVPTNVEHASLQLSRGAKTQQSAVVPVSDTAAVWNDDANSSIDFVVTLYKDASGAFQTKEYALKAQSVTGNVDDAKAKLKSKTFAKTVLDLAPFASLDGGFSAPEGDLTYVTLDSVTRNTPGTVAGVTVQTTWLRDAKGSDAMTEDSGLSGRLAPSAMAASEYGGDSEAQNGDEPTVDEQDLNGFVMDDTNEDNADGLSLLDATAEIHLNTSVPNALTPVREGTPGREMEEDTTVALDTSFPAKTPGFKAGGASPKTPFVANTPTSPPVPQSISEKTTPTRVLVARATAPLLEEIDTLKQKLAEAVTSSSVFESDAVEAKLEANAAREELKSIATQSALFQEKAKKAEAVAKKAIASSVNSARTIQTNDEALVSLQNELNAKDQQLAELDAKAAEEALVLSKEAAAATEQVESLIRESAELSKQLDESKAQNESLAETLQDLSSDTATQNETLTSTLKELEKLKGWYASAVRTKDELFAESVTLKASLKDAKVQLKILKAEKATVECKNVAPRSPLREMTKEETSNLDVATLKKQLEKVTAELKKSEKALSFEKGVRLELERKLEQDKAAGGGEPTRMCSMLWA